MDKQQTLFGESTKAPTAERFAAFIEEHRWFSREVVAEARKRKAQGQKRWSIKAVFELNRHRFPRGPGKHGLDNSFTSYMARHVIKVAPDLEGFFELR